MADEVLVAQFRADVAGLKKQLDDYVASLEKVQKEEKDTQKEVTKTTETNKTAAQKRNQAIKAELAELDKLQAARKKAFTPEAINAFNKKIDESTKKIQALRGATQNVGAGISKTFDGVGNSIKASLSGVAAGIAAAFSVQAVIGFGKASVNSFLEAEESAHKLEFAVTQIGNEGEAAFEKLIKQSKELQDISIFSDENIQGAQTALATFGLASDQIEKLIPKILDFASATKTDLASATDTFVRALEGQTRGLITAGLKFDDTGSRLGNYNKLLEETEKLTGAAAAETETLTGQLKQMENQADELQESIGSRLAQSFVEWRFAALKLFETLIEGFDSLESRQLKARDNQRDLLRQAIEANIQGDAILNGITVEEEAKNKLLEIGAKLNKLDNDRLEAQKKLAEERSKLFNLPEREQAEARVKELEDQRDVLEQQAGVYTDIAALQKGIAKNDVAALTQSEVQLKTLKELNALLIDNQNRVGITAKDNVDLINKELELRKKLADVREAGSAAEIKKLQALGAEYSDLLKLVENTDTTKLIELSVVAELDQLEAIEQRTEQLREVFKNKKLTLPVEVDPNNEFETATEKFNRFKEVLESKGVTVDVTLEGLDFTDFREQVAKLAAELQKGITIPTKLEIPDDRAVTEFEDGIKDISLTITQIWLKENQEILNASQDLLENIAGLYRNFTDSQLIQIEERKTAELSSLDTQQQAIDDQLDKRRISETQANQLSDELTKKRLQTEARAAAEERKIKKKQFDIDKAAALIQIAIDTAVAAVEVLPNFVLEAIIIAAGAVEAGVVASKPNPYFKGTKFAKEGLANVDERGREAIFSPKSGRITTLDKGDKVIPHEKTKKYAKVFDAIYDGHFEDFIFKTEIAPVLMKQKEKHTEFREKSLVNNLTKSMVINNMTNGKGDFYLEQMAKKGIIIRNTSDFNQAEKNPWRS